MNKTIKIALLFVFLTASCDANFRDDKSERTYRAENTANEMLIGLVGPWKILEANSSGYLNGLEMALEEVNVDRPEKGKVIRFIKRDDEANAELGKEIAQELANNLNVTAVIGHFNPHITDVVSIIYEYYGVLMFSPTYTGSFLTNRGFKLVFRNTPTDEEIGYKIADFMKSRRHIWSLVYHLNEPHGRAIANAFGKQTERNGYKVVNIRSFGVNSDNKAFRKMLYMDKKDYRFSAIAFVGKPYQASALLSEISKLGISAQVVGTPSLNSWAETTSPLQKVKGTIISTYFHPDNPTPQVKAFVEKYSHRYNKKPDMWAAQGYDAVKIIVDAMDRAGSAVPEKVAAELRGNDDWTGVTGPHVFNEKGDTEGKPVLFQITTTEKNEYLPSR